MESLSQAIDCSYFALIHHDDLRGAPPNRVNIKHYPQAVADRIIGQCQFRRDPVVRGCLFADSAFLWSDLSRIITISRQDRLCFEQGLRAGLNERSEEHTSELQSLMRTSYACFCLKK